jgi:hypothetical protein
LILVLLWIIRQLNFTFESQRWGLCYIWVASPDGGFDHWFVLNGRVLTLWAVEKEFGSWKLIAQLLCESELTLSMRRRVHREQLAAASERYYCLQPVFDLRQSCQSTMKLQLTPEQIEYPNGLEISVEGFAGDLGGAQASQVFIEVYEGNLQIHVWNGDAEDPHVTVRIEPDTGSTSQPRPGL